MTKLSSEQLRALPKRCETSFIAVGNWNVAAVGQSNTSVQGIGLGILAAQLNGQSNGALVAQHN